MEINMFYNYSNFKLNKKKNFIVIEAEVERVLENITDDGIWKREKCKCIENIVNNKLTLSKNDLYHIVTIKVSNYNAVTDYKKIWRLGDFREIGDFDGYYDCGNNRVYFGIYKNASSFDEGEVEEVKLFVSNSTEIPFEKIFSIFKEHCFDGERDEDGLINTCLHLINVLSNIDKDSIIVYNSLFYPKIFVFGEGIEKKFDNVDLPNTNIVERCC